ncbi:MAG: hypothetical protein K2N15_12525 [Lachnospiraceae bacterium]|nr:hypothetical protein [Lachnospiraceae bacterium]
MKQKFLCIAIVLVMILGTCGCGSSSSSASADSAPAEEGDATYNAASETQNDSYSETEVYEVEDTYTVDELVMMIESGELSLDDFPKKKWFSKDDDRYKDLLGQYIIDGTDISFTDISEYGTVDYWGTIENNKLLLSSHSNINGNDSYREYSFYSFDEILEWE